MAGAYIWLKALHVAFMVTWFAGLFYLPRLFIYHQMATDGISRDRFIVMERRLFAIMTLGAIVTTGLGLGMLYINPALFSVTWLQIKLVLLAGLFVYHWRCYLWMQRLKVSEPSEDTKWLRWFNEIPVVFLLGIIILAVTKLA
ncbi:MAG: CopD family protein [Pseudomonadota bacterium]